MSTTESDVSTSQASNKQYERCIELSKRIRWEIDDDVIRGRSFDRKQKYLPDGLSLVEGFTTLSDEERTFLSQVQGRTYANIFGLVERFINAKVLELAVNHALSDQTALEAMIRFSDEELKHQELFRRIEVLAGETLPPGYRFLPDPNDVAAVVLQKTTWGVLLLTLHIELFTQQHYQESIDPDGNLSPLFKDVFLYHWREESQHAVMDEVELRALDSKLSVTERDQGVADFIELVIAVDGILQAQSESDADYFCDNCGRRIEAMERRQIWKHLLAAYRWQYILSGAQHPKFVKVIVDLLDEQQMGRVESAISQLQ